MANAKEKELLGLQATATDDDVTARILALQERHDKFAEDVIKVLGMDNAVTDEEILDRIAHAVAAPSQGMSAGEAPTQPPNVQVLVLWSRSGQAFNRGGYVVPAKGSLVLDESKMDEIDLRELAADPRVGMARTSDALTPESDVQRYTRVPRPAPAV